jgi:copper chaperone CopZ
MNIPRTTIAAALLLLAPPVFADTVQLEVNGLVCAFCAQGIDKSLRKFAATQDVFVSLEHRLVAVELKPDQRIEDAALRRAISDAGYTTVKITHVPGTLAEVRAHEQRSAGADD